MKNIIIITFSILLTSCGVSNHYVLENSNPFLIDYIKKERKTNPDITKKPLIVIDGKPYRYDVELKKNPINLQETDISSINVLKKEIGIRIYGEYGENGVFIITTKNYKTEKSKEKEPLPDNIFITLDGNEVKKEFLDSINPNDIYSFTVLKGKAVKKAYPNKNYNGVITIISYKIAVEGYRKKLNVLSINYKNLIQNVSIKDEYNIIKYYINDTLLVPKNSQLKELIELDYMNVKTVEVFKNTMPYSVKIKIK